MKTRRKVNNDLLDPASPSGRDDWWEVTCINVQDTSLEGNQTRYIMNGPKQNMDMALDDYIVARAHRGCADCISAILECPGDTSLHISLARAKS